MEGIKSPLRNGTSGPAVANLHAALAALGFPVPDGRDTGDEARYGADTARSVAAFQESEGLDGAERGVVDAETAARMNALLAERGLLDPPFRITGRVVRPDGAAVPGVTVRAVDRLLTREKLLGAADTGPDGRYAIAYERDALHIPERGRPDLIVRVLSPGRGDEEEREALVASPLIRSALPDEVVNLVVGDAPYRGPTLYATLHAALGPYVDGDGSGEGADLDAVEPRDAYALAGATGKPVEQVHHYLTARVWAHGAGRGGAAALQPAAFFGLLRAGLPPDWARLLLTPPAALADLATAAVAANAIAAADAPDVETFQTALLGWRETALLAGTGDAEAAGSFGAVLAQTALGDDQRRAFLTAWERHDGDAESFWSDQRDRLGAAADDVQRTFQLASLVRRHIPTLRALKRQLDDPAANGLADLARYGAEDFERLLERAGVDGHPDIPGEGAARRRAYAGALRAEVERALPTLSAAQALIADPDIDTGALEPFFARNPGFELGRESVRQYLARRPDALEGIDGDAAQRDLSTLQRLYHLAPADRRSAVIRGLWRGGLHSAWSVALQGRAEVAQALGGDLETAMRVQRNAQASLRLSQAYLLYDFDTRTAPIYALPTALADTAGPADEAADLPDIESLFGPQHYCACEHCRSVFGPAAYLVDLLLYLKRAAAPGSQTNPLEALLKRRPDIANLLLDCRNAETVLPHIDLVNEVLENAVTPRGYETREVALVGAPVTLPAASEDNGPPQTTEDAETLAARAEHVNDAAYAALASDDAVFPWVLPFDRPLTELRLLLAELGAPRHEIMASAFGPTEAASEGLDPEEALAAERLDLSPKQFDLLRREETDPSRLGAFWGEDGDPAPALARLDVFMRRSGLDYEAVKRLVDLRWVRNAEADADLEIVFPEDAPCDVGAARLEPLTNRHLDRIHRFLRLQRASGDSFADLDRAIAALGGMDGENWGAFLVNYATLRAIEAAAPGDVARGDALSWVAPLDTHAYADEGAPYARLFLEASEGGSDPGPIFALDAATEDELAEPIDLETDDDGLRRAAIAGALGWSVADLTRTLALNADWLEGPFQLAELSHLAAVASFGRALRLSPAAYRASSAIQGDEPVRKPAEASPEAALRRVLDFVRWNETLQTAGLEARGLDALARHAVELSGDWGAFEANMAAHLTALADALAAVSAEAAKTAGADPQENAEALERLTERTIAETLAGAVDGEPEAVETLLREVLTETAGDPTRSAMEAFTEGGLLRPAEDALVDPASAPTLRSLLARLRKCVLLSDAIGRGGEAVAQLHGLRDALHLPDLSALRIEPFDKRLPDDEAARWRNLVTLLAVDREHFGSGDGVIDALARAQATDPGLTSQSGAIATLAEAAGWPLDLAEAVWASMAGADVALAGTGGVGRIADLAAATAMAQRVGAAPSTIARWARGAVDPASAFAARQALIAKHGEGGWRDAVAPVTDAMREARRDALLAYVLHRRKPDGVPFDVADDVYAHYLIDPSMAACARTSRTVQATASVQQFVQRTLMSLEPGVTLSRAAAEEWTWRKQYRVWEAARKTLLWTENWLEPDLRIEASPFFRDFEQALLQDQLTDENIERAVLGYLEKLDEVARLEVVATHWDDEAAVLHVIGATRSRPRRFFHRRWIRRGDWTPWEPIPFDIVNAEGVDQVFDGTLVVPVMLNRRLHLFWPVFKPAKDPLSESQSDERDGLITLNNFNKSQYDKTKETNHLDNYQLGKQEIQKFDEYNKHFRISLSHSVFYGDNWGAITSCGLYIKSQFFDCSTRFEERIQDYFFIPRVDQSSGRLAICAYQTDKRRYYKCEARFEFDNCRRELKVKGESRWILQDGALPDWVRWQKSRDDSDAEKNPLIIADEDGHPRKLLDTAGRHHLMTASLDRGFFRQSTPLFYEDDARSFFVIPPRRSLRFDVRRRPLGFKDRASQEVIEEEQGGSGVSVQDVAGLSRLDGVFFSKSDARAVISRASAFSEMSLAPSNTVERAAPIQLAQAMPLTSSNVGEVVLYEPKSLFEQGDYTFRTFYHPHTCLFLEQVNRFGLDGLWRPDPVTPAGRVLHRQATPDDRATFDFGTTYNPKRSEVRWLTDLPREDITFDHSDAYALYNWELFYHIPMLIHKRLLDDRQFEKARRYLGCIFDVTETEGAPPQRFWKIKPFATYSPARMRADLAALRRGERRALIEAAAADPFNPHLIARFRPMAYMKATVMAYLDTLIEHADHLFAQDTRESINEAAQLYVLAAQILGERPVRADAQTTEPETFTELAGSLDRLGNAWVALADQQDADAEAEADGASWGPEPPILLAPYFCFPPNETLLRYWDTVGDRLFKIRNCMNIEGVTRQLALFQPPIDPALLIRARAAGLDIGSVLSALYAPPPTYRFESTLARARALCEQARGLGQALLSALEKRDAETLAVLRTDHATALLRAGVELRRLRIEELRETRAAADVQLEEAELRRDAYDEREFMSPFEVAAQFSARIAAGLRAGGAGVRAGAAAARAAPDLENKTTAGLPPSTSVIVRGPGGDKAEGAISAAAGFLEMSAFIAQTLGDMNAALGVYNRRKEDWDLQRDIAQKQMGEIQRRQAALDLQIAYAEHEKQTLDLQIDQSEAVSTHLGRKFSNAELYGWMIGQISGVYFQFFRLAHEVAKQAERAFAHELGVDEPGLIGFGHWDNLRRGLVAGDRLALDLARLEDAYRARNRRTYELTKHVSLRRLDPMALLELRATGRCTFEIPEWLYDLDAPGHYMRRIKRVALSIPAVTGAYTSMHCTLTLLQSKVRRSPLLRENGNGDVYEEDTENEDDRFKVEPGGGETIVTSHGQRDFGLFAESVGGDGRYAPFEGRGAISDWSLRLPPTLSGDGGPEQGGLRQFDYRAISDAILHIEYTALEGGDTLGAAALQSIRARLEAASGHSLAALLDLKRDFPDEWERFKTGNQETLRLPVLDEHFDYLSREPHRKIFEVFGYYVSPDRVEEFSTPISYFDQNAENQERQPGSSKTGEIVFAASALRGRENEEIFIVITYHLDVNARG